MHDYEALHYDKEQLKEACEWQAGRGAGAEGRGPGWGWGRPFSRPGPLRLTQLEFKYWPLLSPEWPGVSAALGPGPGLCWSSS